MRLTLIKTLKNRRGIDVGQTRLIDYSNLIPNASPSVKNFGRRLNLSPSIESESEHGV